jgi:predicted dehydrogenase
MGGLRAAVIGLGVGEGHIEGYLRHPGCQVVAICDQDPDKLAQVHARHPQARACRDAGEVLCSPEVDVVSIATYDDAHYGQVIQALEQGKHVFVEKPLCMRPEELAHIQRTLAARPGLRLSSNLVLRGSPRFLELKAMLERGELGRVYFAEAAYNYGRLHKIVEGWRGRLDYYSVMLGGGVHMVDLLLWLTGGQVVEVSAFGNAIASEGTGFRFPDMVVGILRFADGAVAKAAANFGCVMPHFHELNLYGTQATFINGLDRGLLYTSREKADPPRYMDAPYPGVAKGELIPDFVDSILHGGRPRVSTREVLNTMNVCLALEKAAVSGAPVTVSQL